MNLGLFVVTSAASAHDLVERFDDPFGDWRNRWLPEVCNIANYYNPLGDIAEDRGNNPIGLWISDGDPGGGTVTIGFDREFAESLAVLEIDAACWSNSVFFVTDAVGTEIFTAPCEGGGPLPVTEFAHHYRVESETGIWTWGFRGDWVEGNTAVDNIALTLKPE